MLPNELIGACLTFSTGSDLCASARVARAWQHEAELHLYRDASTLSVYALLSAFRARPLRAAYVRALCVLDYGASDAETTRLLRRLPHLRELRLEMCGGLQPGIAWPFSLRRLVVHTDCDELPAHEFVRFLKSQPELRVLELQSLFDDDRQRALCEAATDMQFLPQLESLRSPACVAAALVPGRPVQHVAVQYLYIEDDCTESVLYDALRRSTRPLLTLKVRCRDGFPRALRDAVPQLRNLELLLYRDRLLEFVIQLEETTQPVLQNLTELTVLLCDTRGAPPGWRANLEELRAQFDVCFPALHDYRPLTYPYIKRV